MLKKPSWFTWFDFLSLVSPGLGTIGLAIYATIVGVAGEHATQGLVLTYIVGALFIVFWGVRAHNRKKWLDTFVWYPTYGFMVLAQNGWHAPDQVTFDVEVKKTVDSWTSFFSNAYDAMMSDIKWVTFQKGLNEIAINPAHQDVKGLTIAGTHTFVVNIDTPLDPIEKTSFDHELGHVIMGNATGNWNQDYHHQFMKEHDLR